MACSFLPNQIRRGQVTWSGSGKMHAVISTPAQGASRFLQFEINKLKEIDNFKMSVSATCRTFSVNCKTRTFGSMKIKFDVSRGCPQNRTEHLTIRNENSVQWLSQNEPQ